MKAKQLFLISALAIVGLTACEKNLYDPHQEDKEVTDLIIPDNFDWQMTKATTCNITSDHSAQLSIYLDEARTEANQLATISVQAGSNISLPLSILKETKNVYIEYETAAGTKAFITAPVDANGNISFAAPADSKQVTTRAENDFENRGRGILLYPKGSGGTILFEDNYPTLGDYDFNDFVARYSAQIETETVPSLGGGRDDIFVTKIEFRIEVVAIGGVDSYIPCLRLPFNKNTIESAKADAAAGGVNTELGMEQETDMSSKDNIVFILKGAEKNDSKPSGSQFLNTEAGFATTNTKRVTLTVTFRDKEAPLIDLTENLFDIFLCKPDKSKEIHLLGYSAAFKDLNNSFIYDPIGNTTYKDQKTNLVWAISIPDDKIAHVLEKVSFLKAYPLFAAWAESGGTSAPNWYESKNNQYLFQFN